MFTRALSVLFNLFSASEHSSTPSSVTLPPPLLEQDEDTLHSEELPPTLASPPPVQKSAPKAAAKRRRTRQISHPEAPSTRDLFLQLMTQFNDHSDPISLIEDPAFDQKIAAIVPLWTVHCGRQQAGRPSMDLALFQTHLDIMHASMSKRFVAELRFSERDVRGHRRLFIAFSSREARVVWMASFIDMFAELYKIPIRFTPQKLPA